jgi:pyridoxine 5-phosphate synthase
MGIKLGVNIDHVATIRNARFKQGSGGHYPCPLKAAAIAEQYGADGITVHLREDRRHIRDADLRALRYQIQTRLNLEMACTEEMIETALLVRPDMVTLVPEKRQELTTEGGLDVLKRMEILSPAIATLQRQGIPVSLFVEPEATQLEACKQAGAQLVELHTGRYCELFEDTQDTRIELERLHQAARVAQTLGLGLNAGHGLHYGNVRPVLDLPGLLELNIGHSLVAEAIFSGLGPAVAKMKSILNATIPPLDHEEM